LKNYFENSGGSFYFLSSAYILMGLSNVCLCGTCQLFPLMLLYVFFHKLK